MSRELICSVLGVPAESWPPDHYSLLGIRPGPIDPVDLEARASDLSARLRTYQLSHPEPVTEALNRIAQALVCLKDPKERAAYDARFAGKEPQVIPGPAREITRTRRLRFESKRPAFRSLLFGRRWLDAWRTWGRWLGEPGAAIQSRRDAAAFIAAGWKVRELARQDEAARLVDETDPGGRVLQLAQRKRLIHQWKKLSDSQRIELATDWRRAVEIVGRRQARQRQRLAGSRGCPRLLRRWARFFGGDGLDVAVVILALAAVVIALFRSRL